MKSSIYCGCDKKRTYVPTLPIAPKYEKSRKIWRFVHFGEIGDSSDGLNIYATHNSDCGLYNDLAVTVLIANDLTFQRLGQEFLRSEACKFGNHVARTRQRGDLDTALKFLFVVKSK